MRLLPLSILIAVVAVGSFAAGAYYGTHGNEEKMRAALLDREISLKAVDLHKSLSTLLIVRQQPDQLAPDLESWITYRLGTMDLEKVAPDSAANPVLREVANRLVEYRTKYPGTTIDPAKDPRVRKLLSFAGPSPFPSNSTAETDARKSAARGSP